MADSEDRASGIAALSPMEYAALMMRVALGVLYLSHSLLMWTIFGLEHAAHYVASLGLPASMVYVIASAELVGALLLLMGVCIREVSIALLPVALGTAVVHLGTGVGASWAYGAYLAGCLAGQALLASGVLTRQSAAGNEAASMLIT